MRAHTKIAAQSLGAGVLLGAVHLSVVSQRFSTDQGPGGLTLLLGCTFITLVLWTMLAMRSLASGGPLARAIDDGLTAMAVTAWLIALIPPREANFWPADGVDDFSWAYLPVSLLVVFVSLIPSPRARGELHGSQVLPLPAKRGEVRRRRGEGLMHPVPLPGQGEGPLSAVWLRLLASLSVSSVTLTGLIFFGSGGAGAEAVAGRGLAVAVLSGLGAKVVWWRSSRSSRRSRGSSSSSTR